MGLEQLLLNCRRRPARHELKGDGTASWRQQIRLPAPLVVGFVAVVILSGCSSTQSGSPSGLSQSSGDLEVSMSAGFADIDGADADLGDFLAFDANGYVFLERAIHEVTRRCMRDAGFDYEVQVPAMIDRRSIFPAPSVLRETGYNIDSAEWSDEPDANQRILGRLSTTQQAAWMEALFGGDQWVNLLLDDGTLVSAHRYGCLATAWTTIYGSVVDSLVYDEVMDLLGAGVYERVVANQSYVDLLAEWRVCLAARGVELDADSGSSRDLAVSYYRTQTTDNARQAELRLAGIDADCLDETGLSALRTTLVEEARNDVVESSQFDIAKVAVFQQRALANAQEMLGG